MSMWDEDYSGLTDEQKQMLGYEMPQPGGFTLAQPGIGTGAQTFAMSDPGLAETAALAAPKPGAGGLDLNTFAQQMAHQKALSDELRKQGTGTEHRRDWATQ